MAWIEKTMEKILVKLILALTFAFVSSCVMAVTLPSTSYTSHYIDDNSYAASSSYDSQLVTMRFEALASACVLMELATRIHTMNAKVYKAVVLMTAAAPSP